MPVPPVPTPDLRLAPDALDRLRSALDDALASTGPTVRELGADARLPRPWLGDPASAATAAGYARHSTDGPQAVLDALAALHAELARVREGLGDTDRAYSAAENAVAASWSDAG